MTYTFGNRQYDLTSRTFVMGILNVTPDSFSDGGNFLDPSAAVEHGLKMIEAGADFIDIGGESTRPGSDPVSAEEEIKRVIPIIEQLARKSSIPISIDTYKSNVAFAALNAGAVIVNDISAMTFDSEMVSVISKHASGVILMHMKGEPKTMQKDPSYFNVTEEVLGYLRNRVQAAKNDGIQQIIVDPGIGFGKKFEHNIQLLKELSRFRELECPILVGPSRKSFLGAILNLPPQERLEGTAAVVTSAILNGANIIRVHDVKEMKRVSLVSDTLKTHSPR